MITLKRIGAMVAVVLVLCCAAVASLFLLAFWKDSQLESPTFAYTNLANAAAHLGGWLPDFLPRSAKNIREKRNGNDGTSVVAFEFDPADFACLSNRFVTVPTNRFREIRPRRIYKQEPWFPKTILKGRLHELVEQGFTIYQTEIEYSGKARLKKRWFAAVNPQKGVGYMWRRYVQD